MALPLYAHAFEKARPPSLSAVPLLRHGAVLSPGPSYQQPLTFPIGLCCKAGALDKLEAFASFNGPDFYGMSRNSDTVTLLRQPWAIPLSYKFGDAEVRPMWAGQTIDWAVVS